MAGFDYDKSAATALRLLTKFGREITLKRITPGEGPAYNPGPSITVTYKAIAAVLPASQGTIEAFDNRLEGGTLIDEKLRFVLMAPQIVRVSEEGPDTIAPLSLDVLNFDGYDWTVIGSTPLSPAGVPVLYRMGVKR